MTKTDTRNIKTRNINNMANADPKGLTMKTTKKVEMTIEAPEVVRNTLTVKTKDTHETTISNPTLTGAMMISMLDPKNKIEETLRNSIMKVATMMIDIT